VTPSSTPAPSTSRVLRGRRALVFAHRGGAKIGPENTIFAFERGIAAGADGLELDVRLSRDGEVVVMHDATVDRTTSATGLVRRLSADELRGIDAAYWFAADGSYPLRGHDIGVPRLADVLARFRTAVLIIELKENDTELAVRTIDLIRAEDATERVAIGSFHGRALRAARAYEPRIPTGSSREETRLALYASRLGLSPKWARYRAFQVPERRHATRIVSPRFVKHAHAAGVVVQVWTVDAPEDIQRLLSWGVDAIISDRPDVAVKVVAGMSA
jgi:glycerophosphoryl diester phosphodiesterase